MTYWAAAHADEDEELFRDFVGPNADKYTNLYLAMEEGRGYLRSFNWVVLFFPLPWFFYRKLYLIGLLIFLAPVVLGIVFPELAGIGGIAISVGLAIIANGLYVSVAKHRLNKIIALDLPPFERDQRIKAAGGVSVGGAIFGVVIIISLVLLAVVAAQST